MNSLYDRYCTLIIKNLPSAKEKLKIFIRKYWSDLQDNYSTNIYHDFNHIKMGLDELDKDQTSLEFRAEVEFAEFYHDYIVGCRDAEILSTMFALQVRNSMKLILIPSMIAECIAETKFVNLMKYEKSGIPELDIMHDLDLVILGKPREIFMNYDNGIIQEYGAYFNRDIRKKILFDFYSNKKIYRTERFLDLYETKAKENLKWILSSRYGGN